MSARLAAMAEAHYKEHLPQTYAALTDPGQFFRDLGKHAQEQIDALTEALQGPDPAGEAFADRMSRHHAARQTAESEVIREWILPAPDPQQPDSTPDDDDFAAEMASALDDFAAAVREFHDDDNPDDDSDGDLVSSDLASLMQAIRVGERTVESVAAQFRTRSWPTSSVTPHNAEAAFAPGLLDRDPDPPGSFSEVAAAFYAGAISDHQYRVLLEAATEAVTARDDRSLPDASSQGQFFLIQDPGDAEPYALILADRGICWWWTHEGWVDTPAFAMYFAGGEIGARPLPADQVAGWQNRIQKPAPGVVAMMRGRQ